MQGISSFKMDSQILHEKMKFLFIHVNFYKNPFWWEYVKIQYYSILGGFKNDYIIYGRTLLVYFPGEDIVFSCLVITIVS